MFPASQGLVPPKRRGLLASVVHARERSQNTAALTQSSASTCTSTVQEVIDLLEASEEAAHHPFPISLVALAHCNPKVAVDLLYHPSAVLQSLRHALQTLFSQSLYTKKPPILLYSAAGPTSMQATTTKV